MDRANRDELLKLARDGGDRAKVALLRSFDPERRRPTPTCPIPTTAARAGSRTSSTSASAPAAASSSGWRAKRAQLGDVMDAQLKTALSAAIGREVVSARAIPGGDINRAYELVLPDGRRFFAKANDRVQRRALGMFAAEARGLGWLREAGALRIPEVVAVSRPGRPAAVPGAGASSPTGAPARDFDEQLGRGLASLHRQGAPTFGLDHDNFIGWLPQVECASGDLGRVLPDAAARAAPAARGRRRARLVADAGGLRAAVRDRSTICSVPPSRRRACTAICGAATSSATIAAGRASSTRPSTAVTARSIWR